MQRALHRQHGPPSTRMLGASGYSFEKYTSGIKVMLRKALDRGNTTETPKDPPFQRKEGPPRYIPSSGPACLNACTLTWGKLYSG